MRPPNTDPKLEYKKNAILTLYKIYINTWKKKLILF